MIKLKPENFSSIAPLFNPDNTPNFSIVMAVIYGNNPGKVWVDNIENPKICLIISDGGYSFIGNKSKINENSLMDIITILKNHSPIKLIWAKEESVFSIFINEGFTPIRRIQFYHPEIIKKDLTRIDKICETLPSGFEIQTINDIFLKKCHWLSFIKQIYGSQDNFLNHGFGLVLLKNNNVMSEAFAGFVGDTSVETVSFTAPKYRQLGYATIVRAFLIKESLLRNLVPETSCDVENLGSAKSSLRLGFKEKKKYWFLKI